MNKSVSSNLANVLMLKKTSEQLADGVSGWFIVGMYHCLQIY